MVIATFADLGRSLKGQPPLRAAVAGAEDEAVLAALIDAMDLGLVSKATLTGNVAKLRAMLPASRLDAFSLIEVADAATASALAVAEVRAGRADVLVKGTVDSPAYLKAILSRESGLRAGPVLANLTIAEMPSVPRLIGATDNGILPLPTLDQKRAILLAAVSLFSGLGVSPLRVAAIAASEKISAAQPATVDAQTLAAESRAGTLPGLIVDGPFGYDVALSEAAAAKKGLAGSSVAGRADLILFPSLEAGNATVKAWKLHGGARTGSLVLGATVPVLLNSRADGAEQRRLGLLLALAMRRGHDLGA